MGGEAATAARAASLLLNATSATPKNSLVSSTGEVCPPFRISQTCSTAPNSDRSFVMASLVTVVSLLGNPSTRMVQSSLGFTTSEEADGGAGDPSYLLTQSREGDNCKPAQ